MNSSRLGCFFFGSNMIPYLVSAFAKSTLSNLVKECFGSDFPDVLRKRQIGYVYRYLSDLGAKSIVLEFDYLDRDYLEDYARYYVKRFSGGGKSCARLHFFSTEVDHGMIESALTFSTSSETKEKLQAAYLGFVVVKPLPKTFIGKTCLKKYDTLSATSGAKRAIAREYSVDLFGISLTVESIAFQEQDRVVAACATTAIWAALHATRSRQIRDIPACSEITINAINHVDGSSNSFPSKELSNKQILRALDIEHMRNHYQSLDKIAQDKFLEIVKCHIDSGLPLILGAEVFSIKEDSSLSLLAGHAVTVLGYKNKVPPAIYIHDDRLGPYARATFVQLKQYKFNGQRSTCDAGWGLVLQEKDDSGSWSDPHEILVPTSLIVPANQKVRLPHSFADSTCHFIVNEYENWLSEIATKKNVNNLQGQVDFSIRLAEISEIRREVINYDFEHMGLAKLTDIDGLEKDKIRFLTKSYARFHWVAEFRYANAPAFQVLFDATDIPQGDAVAGIFVKNRERADAILAIFAQYAKSREKITEPQTENFYVSFLKQLRNPDRSFDEYLNSEFGELRAPKYLKESETAQGKIAENTSRRQYYLTCDKTLEDEFPDLIVDDDASYLIWAIAYDGSLLLGKEIDQIGHPGLTGFKPARIAGELRHTTDGWVINSKSGRYSKDYSNSELLLNNAVEKFNSVFYLSRGRISASHFAG